MKLKKEIENSDKGKKRKPVKQIIDNIKQIDQTIESNVGEFIDWIEEEKKKVY